MRDRQRPAPTRDLDTSIEIAEMVRRFYADVAQDHLLGPMFNDVAKVNWSERCPFTAAHFEQWLGLFNETLDLGWVGPRTEQARRFAARVARVHSRQLVGRPAPSALR
jgi:hemoglobin